jgi:hypothetical protein
MNESQLEINRQLCDVHSIVSRAQFHALGAPKYEWKDASQKVREAIDALSAILSTLEKPLAD